MSISPYAVALVLDPEFGEKIVDLASRIHVWVVASPTNCSIAKALWGNQPIRTPSIETGITTFDVDLNATPEQWCKGILGTIDLHHGEHSHTPPYSRLEIYGLPFNDTLRLIFSDYGFTSFQQTDHGFKACIPAP
jgi:hypothetical protein